MKKISKGAILLLLTAISCNEIDENLFEQKAPKVKLGVLESRDASNGKTQAYIITPENGTYNAGATMIIKWDFVLDGDWSSSNVHLDLYKGSSLITRIAKNIPFFTVPTPSGSQGEYSWVIPSMQSTGSDYIIKITNAANSSQTGYSDYFTLATPNTGCFFSRWSLTGSPGSISNNTTVQYQIQEDGLAQQIQSNTPSLVVNAAVPINVIYNGTTYYCAGGINTIIPINGTSACNGTNPIISAPLTFQKIGSGFVFVWVALQSVSAGHYTAGTGYHSFYIN